MVNKNWIGILVFMLVIGLIFLSCDKPDPEFAEIRIVVNNIPPANNGKNITISLIVDNQNLISKSAIIAGNNATADFMYVLDKNFKTHDDGCFFYGFVMIQINDSPNRVSKNSYEIQTSRYDNSGWTRIELDYAFDFSE